MGPIESVFTRIVRNKEWSKTETPCGPGSFLSYADPVIQQLPLWIEKYGIRSIVDLGCGDFNWMRMVDLKGLSYDGFDIVKDLVDEASKKYPAQNVRFHHADVSTLEIQAADLVLCKDVMIHLPDHLVLSILAGIRRSGSRYLAATTFEGHPNAGRDPEVGGFGALDLGKAPFSMGISLEGVGTPYHGWPGKRFDIWRL